jgi:hypothetical protein
VHVGAWDYFEPGKRADRYLRSLITACHRHNVLVYAWLELPHVSTRFWAAHPEWREKTARLKDAHVDWRLLMNLANPACYEAVRRGVGDMMARFDWDGINLAELYFDGTQGIARPAEFTPLNNDVRREFRNVNGFDPYELFRGIRDPVKLRAFLDYRSGLVARLQERWIEDLERMREQKPALDLVVTYVDDRFDTIMRDAIGADAARALRLLDTHAMTFVIEDPGTMWRLGPERYAKLARLYAELTTHHERVGVDINVVERGERASPTRKQVGAELLELLHTAAGAFAQVVLYAESTIGALDLPFLPPASAVVTRFEQRDGGVVVESPYGVGIRWSGPARVDGVAWPVQDGEIVWLPAGRHLIESTPAAPSTAVLDLSALLKGARLLPDGIELAYSSRSRALASMSHKPVRLLVDGHPVPIEAFPAPGGAYAVSLPKGEHVAILQ